MTGDSAKGHVWETGGAGLEVCGLDYNPAYQTVLIVDDEERNLKLLEAMLFPLNCRVVTARTGINALEMVRQESPDLILLDIMLPQMDGFEVCRLLKASVETSSIPIVMITALTDPKDRIKGLEAGADDFLSRPVNKVELLVRVRSLLKLKALQDRVKKEDKLRFLGQLAAAAAHEIRNPLAAVRYFVQALAIHHPDDRDYADAVVNEVDRINGIVERMLLLKPKKLALVPGDIGALLHESMSLIDKRLEFSGVNFVMDLDPGLPPVKMDLSQIKQVFLNILINACEAMDGRGNLYITAKHNPEDSSVLICFRDQGHGMSADVLDRVFEPFFTTKAQGTGLGLAVSYQIMKHHGGELIVDSVEGEGTTVVIKFPVSASIASSLKFRDIPSKVCGVAG